MNTFTAKVKERCIVLFYFLAILFVIVIIRLINIQVFQHENFSKLAKLQHTGVIETTGLRGTIYDRNGKPLAQSLNLSSIAANPRQIKNKKFAAVKVAQILKTDESQILNAINTNTTFAWIKRKIDDNIAKKIEDLKIEGVFLLKEPTGKRFYPKGSLASDVIGLTGIDDQGLSGIEAYYDNILKNKTEYVKTEIDLFGIALPFQNNTNLTPKNCDGKSIYLTIDETIQYIAEKELKKQVLKYNAKNGTCLVMDPNTGDILALANFINKKNKDNNQMRNIAICDAYEPGSTYKVFLATAALDSGRITETDRFSSGSSITVDGWTLQNADDGLVSPSGSENIEGIITYSFNTGAASVGLKIGADVLSNYTKLFGFGALTGIDLPGETEGIILPREQWAPISVATISYGQGIAVTPIQLLCALSSIANGGFLVKPRVVKAFYDKNTDIITNCPPKEKKRVISLKTSISMTNILQKVVESGTGKAAKIPGYRVAGKTGTASVVENGQYISGKYISSFIGFVPAEDPKLVILVKIQEPQGCIWGGAVAAPVFQIIGKEALWKLKIPPTLPTELENNNLAP